MTQIINCTPHPIHIIREGKVVQTLPVSGIVIRLKASTVSDEPINDIPTSRTQFGQAEGLPDQQEGIFLIVSQLVKSAFPDRTDLLVPAEMVRDEQGNIIGCQSLGR